MLAGPAIVASQVSINFGAAKAIFPAVGPEAVAMLRTGISAVLLLIFARPWRASPTPTQLGWLTVYGSMLGGMSLLIYWAIERIPIGVAVAIEICGPLAVVLGKHGSDSRTGHQTTKSSSSFS
nr:EamA family transporter [Sphingomonas xinjiangensis]